MKKNPLLYLIAIFIITTAISTFILISFADDDVTDTDCAADDWTLSEVTGATVDGREWYNFADYSEDIKNDGSEDVSDLLQACVNEHDNVFIPSGIYLCKKQVSLHDNSGIMGEDEYETKFIIENNSVFGAYGTNGGDGVPIKIKNIYVAKLSLENKNETFRAFIVQAYAVSGLTVRNIHSVNCGIADVNTVVNNDNLVCDESGEYKKYISDNIIISDSTADGGDYLKGNLDMYGGAVGLMLCQMTRFVVANCEIHSFTSCIEFVGGPPLYEDCNGYDKMGKFSDGIIQNCHCYDAFGGGIWGCMPYKIIVANNTVHDCNDTGIDFEGGDRCIVENNTVYNCYDNFMVLDHFSGHFIYRGNHSYFKDADVRFVLKDGVPVDYGSTFRYHFYYCDCGGATPCADNQNFVLENNVFESDTISYIGAGYYISASLNKFIFRGNICNNAILSSVLWRDISEGINKPLYYGQIMRECEVTGNTFNINVPIDGYFEHVIDLYSADPDSGIVCENNTINIHNAGITEAIHIEQSSAHGDVTMSVKNNTMNEGGIRIVNRNTFLTIIAFENNITENVVAEGNILFSSVNGNKTPSGEDISEDGIFQTGKIVAPKKTSVKNTAYSPKIAVGIDRDFGYLGMLVWKGAEEYSFKSNDGSGLDGNFKVLWEDDEREDVFRLTFCININKTSRLNNEGVRIALALNGAYNGDVIDKDALGGTVTVKIRGQKTVSGALFEQAGINHYTDIDFNDDVTAARFKIAIVIPKSIKEVAELISSAKNGKQPFIRLNVTANSGKDNTGCGWVALASEKKVQSLGKLVLNNYIPTKKSGDVLCGDVNGDGKIKGSDATLLLKYLAGWNVTINEANADCNGDGKIRGNDSTLLLKYLAGWNVAFGS